MLTPVEINISILLCVLKYWHRIHQVSLVFLAGLEDDLK